MIFISHFSLEYFLMLYNYVFKSLSLQQVLISYLFGAMLRYSIPIVHQQFDTYEVVCIGTEDSNKSRLLAKIMKKGKQTVPQRQNCKIVDLDHKQIRIKFRESTYNSDRSLLSKYNCRHSNGIIFIYDVSNKQSFCQISNMPQLGQLKPKMLIGYQTNKSREVSQDQAAEFALEHELLFQQICEWSSQLDFIAVLAKLAEEIFFTQYRRQVNNYFSKQSPRQSFSIDCPMHSSNMKTYLSIVDRKLSSINRKVYELTNKCSIIQAEKIQLSCKAELLTEIKEETQLQLLRMQQRYKKMHSYFCSEEITQVMQVIDMYEREALKLKEQFLEKQSQLKQQVNFYRENCKLLQQICIEVEDITIDNFIATKDHILRGFNRYKLLYCEEDSILDHECVEQFGQKANLDNILLELQSDKSFKEQSTAYQSEILQAL